MSAPRRLLTRLRDLMAKGDLQGGLAPMSELVRMVAAELVSEVCSIYIARPGDILELYATEGLRLDAVGQTRLRVGEGIVGLAAATHATLNLADAQNHPAFAYRPETGEEKYASMLAVPVRRGGRTLGVLAVQNRNPRHYDEAETEVMETVAMLLAEVLAATGAEGTDGGLAATVPRRFGGVPLAAGLAIGPVKVLGPVQPPIRVLAENPRAEQARLDAAVRMMRRNVNALVQDGLAGADGAEAEASREILDAYRLVAEDSGWLKRVGDAIGGGLSAEAAVHRVAGDLRDRMRRIVDPYLRERLSDIEDLIRRLMQALDGNVGAPKIAAGTILLVRRMGPAELLEWHAAGVAGVVIEEASPSGHAAILARALGLPALAGAAGVLEAANDGDEAVLVAEDGDSGQLILRPEQEVVALFNRAVEARSARQAGFALLREQPNCTRDGVDFELNLNIGLALELAQLEATGAAGIGLFRTEIAMLARGAVADVADQAAVYAQVLDAAGDRPVLFRTLDLGGDKLLPGTARVEENPAMGWRSLRIGLDRPAVLRRQLRALLLAAGGRRLSIMFPMVATVAELRAAKSLLRTELARVRPQPVLLEVGTMLEVPSLLWQLSELLREVDFVSIGSNDLMQFLFTADRGTPGLAGRYDFLSPPVLDLLADVAGRCAAAGVKLSVCGEHASRPLEAMTLLGLGITSLSMPASGVLPVKSVLTGLDVGQFRAVLAGIRRTAAGAASVREPIAAWAREHGVLAGPVAQI